MRHPVNQAAIDLLKGVEGLRLSAYQDSIGVFTIGYGHIGEDVHPGLQISEAQAEAFLRQDLEQFEAGVSDALNKNVSTTDNQYSAMVLLAFNIGLSNFVNSKVLREHNAGNHQAAADAFLMWDKAGGRVFDGLSRRRQSERDLYLQS
jgi:lysozyme